MKDTKIIIAGDMLPPVDDQNLLPDHLFRSVPLFDAGEDLACLASDLHLAAEELPGLFDFLALDDFADLDLKLREIVDGDFWFFFIFC